MYNVLLTDHKLTKTQGIRLVGMKQEVRTKMFSIFSADLHDSCNSKTFETNF